MLAGSHRLASSTRPSWDCVKIRPPTTPPKLEFDCSGGNLLIDMVRTPTRHCLQTERASLS